MKNFEQGDKIKFQKPKARDASTRIGHSIPNTGVMVAHNGQEVFLEYGSIFQVSENTSAEVANMDNSPLPLVNAAWVNQTVLKEQFTLIKTEE